MSPRYQVRTTLPPRRPLPGPRRNRKPIVLALVAAVLLLLCIGVFFVNKAVAPHPAGTRTGTTPAATPTPPAGFNKQAHSTTDPASLWVIVNKQHRLSPKDYTPGDLVFPGVPLRVPGNESMQLRKETAAALEQLVAGAKTAGFNLMLSSGYRSYSYQVGLYNGYVKSMGQAEADKTSARPGHSEHQTGLALDIEPATRACELDACFGNLPEGKWVADNAYMYGFIIRYPADKVAVTGYEYEPWHLRYVGIALAAELKKQNITTLEEFFGVSGGQSY